MKKVFFSQPMRGKPAEEITAERENARNWLKKEIGEFELVNTFFRMYDGCRCEHFIAAQYGVQCLYYQG
ncbi:hypothetical protein PilKf_02627 [Pillotina sp. SPG140]